MILLIIGVIAAWLVTGFAVTCATAYIDGEGKPYGGFAVACIVLWPACLLAGFIFLCMTIHEMTGGVVGHILRWPFRTIDTLAQSGRLTHAVVKRDDITIDAVLEPNGRDPWKRPIMVYRADSPEAAKWLETNNHHIAAKIKKPCPECHRIEASVAGVIYHDYTTAYDDQEATMAAFKQAL